MGLVAIIMSVIGLGPVGIVMGHLGLRAARRGQASNRGTAMVGAVVGYASVAVLAGVLVVMGAIPGFKPFGPSAVSPSVTVTTPAASTDYTLDTTLTTADQWFGLSLGDCVDSFDSRTDPQDLLIEQPTVVPCSDPHYGEVYAIAEITGDAAPDDATFALQSREVCTGQLFTTYVGGDGFAASELYYDVLYPAERSWDNGTHQMVCLLVEKGESTTGSLRGSGR